MRWAVILSTGRPLLAGATLALSYWGLAMLGLEYATIPGNVTPIWPAGGLALAALIVLGEKLWPAIFLGSFLSGISTGDAWPVAAFIALGNSLESLAGKRALARMGFDPALEGIRDYIFLLATAFATPCIGALLGPGALYLHESVARDRLPDIVQTWWMADSLGIVVVVPLLLTWRRNSARLSGASRTRELSLSLAIFLLLGGIVFQDWFGELLGDIAKPTLLFPFLVWIAWRFGRRGAALALLIQFAQSLHGAARHTGYFAQSLAADRLSGLWFYNLGLSAAIMALAIARHENLRRHNALRDSEKRFHAIFDHVQEGILITDALGDIVDVNRAFTHITGYSREDMLGKNPRLLQSGRHDHAFYARLWHSVAEQGYWSGEIWNRRKNGEEYPQWLNLSVIRDERGAATHYVGAFSDITQLKRHQRELEFLAHYDPLTGVPNRTLLADRIKLAAAQTRREGRLMAVGFLDLDGFKPINDRLGHEAGDRLLIEIAQRIKNALRASDTVARLGGDEFAFLLLGLDRQEECENTLKRLLQTLAAPMVLSGQTVGVTASVGVCFYPLNDADEPEILLRYADQAMYAAKQSGKNRFHIHDPAQERRNCVVRSESSPSLEEAFERRDFELHYQPKIELATGRLLGFEALLRWPKTNEGIAQPDSFLPQILQNSRLSVMLDRWVIQSALRQMSNWRAAGLDLSVSVNLSAHSVRARQFVEDLRALFDGETAAISCKLELEIKELEVSQDLSGISKLIADCRALGIRFALDDFGVGYSSLGYLKLLPLHTLKIDRSFVFGILDNPEDVAIVKAAIALAEAFRLQAVAQGIENEEQGLRLLRMGCRYAQGYAIAPAMPARHIPEWINVWRTPTAWREWNLD